MEEGGSFRGISSRCGDALFTVSVSASVSASVSVSVSALERGIGHDGPEHGQIGWLWLQEGACGRHGPRQHVEVGAVFILVMAARVVMVMVILTVTVDVLRDRYRQGTRGGAIVCAIVYAVV